ncbi:hypothetical protein ACQEVZ_54200 [Dactylosporangium sp. CA-152071]|uniref:hypothetical protein n=1 Tax=Dactylosporangium sp. CA-152071 TaxID=3239933 RepID=UPI003D93AB62
MVLRRALVLLCLAVGGPLLWPGTAQAHPLGNFSVNQLGALTFHPDRVTVDYVADLAELPTLQSVPSCTTVAPLFRVAVDGRPVGWTVDRSSFTYSDGAAGLRTSRLECAFSGAFAVSGPSTVDVVNDFAADRVGWRELTAVAAGVHIVGSPLPTVSASAGLRSYPADLLSSPPAVHRATLRLEPGGSTGPAAQAPPGPLSSPVLPGWAGTAELKLRGWVASRSLTPWVGVLAVLLALALGAAHAALPGHGKTVMAAYLAGRAGRPRDALTVGATVTLTHTGGVLLLGLLLTTAAGLAGETVLGWLGVTSGVLVATIGLTMLLSRRASSHDHSHSHSHAAHSHSHGPAAHSHGADSHTHSHGSGSHDHDHDHDHDHAHDHGHPHRLALVGMGIAGGLVPSPSALVVLLGAVALGRTWFGVLLVLAYGFGMAATLTAAGLLLIKIRDRWPARLRISGRLTRLAPTGTAALVLLVGSALAVRSLVTL